MKILQVTQTYYPYLHEGGRPSVVLGLSKRLVRRGHQVTVLTSNYDRPFRSKRSSHGGIETIYLGYLLRHRVVTLNPGLLSFRRRRLREFDVVHVHGIYDLLGPAVARSCRKWNVPYIIETEGMYRPIARNISLKKLYHRLFGKTFLEGAARYVATSERERGQLEEEGLPAEKIELRRNGLDLDEFEDLPPPGRFRSKKGVGEKDPLLLFIGRISHVKGLDLLVNAFAEVPPPAKLVIAGPDDRDGTLREIERMSDRSHLGERLLLPGPLYGREKLEALADADLLILPSRNENFGIAAGEAVACGTPVLLTDRCGIAPLLKEKAALVVPFDVEALRDGITRLIEDDELREGLRTSCAEVASKLSWDEPAKMMEEIYRKTAVDSHPQAVS